jgi:hypothetical protein
MSRRLSRDSSIHKNTGKRHPIAPSGLAKKMAEEWWINEGFFLYVAENES